MPWRQLRLGCHPPGLFDRLKSLPSFEPRELALDMKLEAKAIEGCAAEEYADWIKLHTRREQLGSTLTSFAQVHRMAADVLREQAEVLAWGADACRRGRRPVGDWV